MFVGLMPLGVQAQNSNSLHTSDSYVNELNKLAEDGDVRAQTCLGEMYREGTIERGDSGKATYWFKKAADKGDTRGKYLLALMKTSDVSYQTETYQEYRDRMQAAAFIQKLADQGYPPAEANIGFGYLYQEDYAKALAVLRKAGNQDNPAAEVMLGFMYKYGFGIDSNPTIAQQWFAKIADYRIDCVGDFAQLIYNLIAASVSYPQAAIDGKSSGRVLLMISYRASKVAKAVVYKAANDEGLNIAALRAAQEAYYPQWSFLAKNSGGRIVIPVDFTQQNPFLSILSARNSQYQNLRSEIQYAIQKNIVFPKHVLVYGTSGTGSVTLSFMYRDGRVSNVKIQKSANDRYEDEAALTAVKGAHYTLAPSQYVGKILQCVATIEYRMSPETTVVSNIVLH